MKLNFHFITSFFKIKKYNKIKINKNSIITKNLFLTNFQINLFTINLFLTISNRILILLIFPHLDIYSRVLQLRNPPFHTID